jgi:hypothetical protein
VKLGDHELPYHHETVEYVVISEQPYGGWEYSSSGTEDPQESRRRLALARTNRPDQQHRLGVRTTTVHFDVLPDENQPHHPCNWARTKVQHAPHNWETPARHGSAPLPRFLHRSADLRYLIMSVLLECERCRVQEKTGSVMILARLVGPGLPSVRPELPDGWTRPQLPTPDGELRDTDLCPQCKRDLIAFMDGAAVEPYTAEPEDPCAPGGSCPCPGGDADCARSEKQR